MAAQAQDEAISSDTPLRDKPPLNGTTDSHPAITEEALTPQEADAEAIARQLLNGVSLWAAAGFVDG